MAALSLGLATATAAQAFRIELKDVAPDRIERQRAEAIGQIPFPGTPNIAQFDQRLKEKGFTAGSAMFIRVFKAENELEVWLQKGDRFELFASYPMCHWSGTLGPKVVEGDKQSPEGVYTVTKKQLHYTQRHPKALNLGFPNMLDKQFSRTGSWVLIHGGCGSVGCFAMTNPVIDEIFTLAQAALKNGQDAIHVHAFPFRLTEQKLHAYALHEWYDFWRNLKDVHDAFEKSKRVPKVVVCEGRYWVEPDGEVASQSPLAVCGAPLVASLKNPQASASSPTAWSSPIAAPNHSPSLNGQPALLPSQLARSRLSSAPPTAQPSTSPPMAIQCDRNRASCRKWIAAQTGMAQRSVRTASARPTAAAAQSPRRETVR